MRAHESQNQSSQFTAKFQEIEDDIDYLKNLIQNVVSKGQIMSKIWSQYNTKLLVKISSFTVHSLFFLTAFS